MTEMERAERAFLAAAVASWREIDRGENSVLRLAVATALRQQERAAWERYRDLLDAQ